MLGIFCVPETGSKENHLGSLFKLVLLKNRAILKLTRKSEAKMQKDHLSLAFLPFLSLAEKSNILSRRSCFSALKLFAKLFFSRLDKKG